MSPADSPAIILIRPQMGENIGAAARAMHNFGLRDLRIVAPRDGWPNEAARSMAAHAVAIVDNAKIYATTRDAVADLQRVVATTARRRELAKPLITPEDLNPLPVGEGGVAAGEAGEGRAVGLLCNIGPSPQPSPMGRGGKIGILFGRESSGLDNEDVAEADAILQIPTAPDNQSLNLAQAVLVVAYEWFKGQSGRHSSHEEGEDRIAPKSELQGLFDQLEVALDEADYWRESGKKEKMWRNLRNLLTRAQMTSQEVRSMRGVVRALVRCKG